jgi:hypothetical protein
MAFMIVTLVRTGLVNMALMRHDVKQHRDCDGRRSTLA